MAILRPRKRRTSSDEALIRSLYEEHGGALIAYATRLTGDRTAAEDVLQETLLRAWRHAHELSESTGSIRGWLFTVARNIITDRARARSVRPTEVAESPVTVPVSRDHSDQVVDSIVALDALETLSEEHRSVLVEIYFRGRTVTETAEHLGIPPGTVKSRSHNAMKSLREHVIGRRAQAPGTSVARVAEVTR
ncbi:MULTISPECIES: sigma-70 family RNA polymerase sigma factor [Catenuloplanes]|uniref:RNA polymerase sigma-70 factor (ECF subfamily) n=1 Tax=Catenuloplanes niger TaxID=587534 RepID=A0AAE4CZ77_9ACTN|nr:sigma-70 family RNA polymerase sigma factor [Catenuloplanes niger]MDR7326639.1 RNA polymerase sigma-70 factor (ECF subfamily) [Catenuloplanes niger]